MNGNNLLAEFRASRSELAFSDLVRRYTNLVYSVAKRRVGNDSLAREVTQIVFIRLAKAAPDLRGDAELVAWLHRTTVHVSIDLWRSETRRRAREEKAVAMQIHATEIAPWNDLAPVLDEALNELNDADRAAILLRFFDEKSMQEVGTVFEVSEDAAKMRVSRALDRLRNQLSARGVACSAMALAAVLTERAVEAAPAQFANSLAAFKWPVRASLGAGILGVLPQVATLKMLIAVSAIVGVSVAMFVFLRSPDSTNQVGNSESEVAAVGSGAVGGAQGVDVSEAADPQNIVDGESTPDPLKLLQTVARARQRIVSGVVELQVFSEYRSPDHAHWKETNVWQMKVKFDGQKLNFEQIGREYAYSLPAPKAEDQKKQIQTEKLDKQAAIQAGLLKGFEARYVTVFDGEKVSQYRETDRSRGSTAIDLPGRSASYLFDPRCLGLRTFLSAGATVENYLGLNQPKFIKLLGKEAVDGTSAWHVQVHSRHGELLDFWIEEAVPSRLLKFTKGDNELVLCKYSGRNPIPIEVTASENVRGSGPSARRVMQTKAELDIPIDASFFTLAGLGMPVGTDVIDVRIHRRIGYWTGTGLSDNFPAKKTNDVQTPPNVSEMLTTLDNDPASEAGLRAATWIVLNTPDGPEVEKASDVILREHIENTNLVQLAEEMDRMRHRSSTNLLEAMLEENSNPEIRAIACFTLATFAKDEGKYGANKKATVQAEELFQRVVTEFASAGRKGSHLAEKAERELYELRTLTIGKPAPEAAGVDLEGEPMKLSDFRGNVVMVTFWEGEYHEAEEHGKLAERFQGSPFSLVSVNTDKDLARAKAMVEKYNITWRSFRDGHRNGPIWTTWNARGWPNVYVLDRNGIIRYRHVYGHELTKAVETLLAE